MKRLIVCLLAIGVVAGARVARAQSASENATAIAGGKAIFVSRCAKCHDADANKKLADGTTLLGRLAASKNPQARLATRLKSEQETHEVMLYMQPLLERLRISQAAQTH